VARDSKEGERKIDNSERWESSGAKREQTARSQEKDGKTGDLRGERKSERRRKDGSRVEASVKVERQKASGEETIRPAREKVPAGPVAARSVVVVRTVFGNFIC
jgi:hypothetical protein